MQSGHRGSDKGLFSTLQQMEKQKITLKDYPELLVEIKERVRFVSFKQGQEEVKLCI